MSKDDELLDAPNQEMDEDVDTLFDEDTDEEGDGTDKEPEPEKGSKEYWEQRARRAEGKIVKDKTAPKASKSDTPAPKSDDVATIVAKQIEERDFYKENPDLVERKKEIDGYVAKWLKYEEAKLLVTRDERRRESNAKRSNSQRITGSSKPTQSHYTTADLEAMNQAEYNSVMERREKGEVTVD